MQMRTLVDRAMRIAMVERTVTCIILPNDIQDEDAVAPTHAHNTIHTGIGQCTPRVVPKESDLKRAAEILNSGKKVAMLVGAGALRAADEVMDVADMLGAGVAKALLGKAVLPDDLPYVTGSIGLLGTRPSWDMMQDCDTLLMVGTSFPYSEFLPKEGQARGVQIDIDGRMLSLRYPMEVAMIGDSAESLRALMPFLERKTDRSWRHTIESNVRDWWGVLEGRAHDSANPINPQRVFWELSPKLPDRCILASDSGSSANWFARDLKIRKGMMASLSGNLATMGPGVPYAIGAKFAYPDRPVIALVGDGAMQMNGNSELLTIAKYWKEWSDPRLIVMVLHNNDLNQVTWEQRAMEGNPRFEASQEIPNFPYAAYAESIGLKGVRVDNPDNIASAWDQALAMRIPCVYEAITDPNVPPLPPHISLEQAKSFMSSIVHGDPERGGMIKQSMKAMAESMLPHPGRGG
jgi:pyruvate dehydrogenase (quinone)